jgi:hypothetical protein
MLSGMRKPRFGPLADFGLKAVLIAAKPLSFRGEFAPNGRQGRFLTNYKRRSEGEPNG